MIDQKIFFDIIDGNIKAYEVFYNEYKKKIYHSIISILGNNKFVEDIFQEILTIVYKKIKQLKDISKFEPWLYRIIYNCCMKYIKKESNLSCISYDTEMFENIIIDKEIYDVEEVHIINNILYTLPKHYRVPIILFYYKDMNISDIATIMKCSQGTIKSRLHNAKKIIKRKFEHTLGNSSKDL